MPAFPDRCSRDECAAGVWAPQDVVDLSALKLLRLAWIKVEFRHEARGKRKDHEGCFKPPCISIVGSHHKRWPGRNVRFCEGAGAMFWPIDPVTGQPGNLSLDDVKTIWKAVREWMSQRRATKPGRE
jgi:hypothetical protein